MKKVVVVIVILILTNVCEAVNNKLFTDRETISIVAAAKTTSGTVYLKSVKNYSAVSGTIIVPISTYSGTGFHVADTLELILKSSHGALSYTLDSVLSPLLPCTLFVNNHVDSLFLEKLYIEFRWSDSIAVVADSTARTTIITALKLIE